MTDTIRADFIFDIAIPVTGLFWLCFIYYSAYLSKKYKVLIPWTEANKRERFMLNAFISGSLGGIILIVLFAFLNK